MHKFIYCAAVLATLSLTFAASADNHQGIGDDLVAYMAPKVTESLLLDGDRVDGKLIVVGEHGHIIISTDDGRTWTQAPVPTRSALTGVDFVDPQNGWAVGHDAVILRTTDGGKSWERVHFEPDWQTPLLDVWFANAKRGIAIGAYGLYLVTNDGGTTWTRRPFNSKPLANANSESDDEIDAGDDLADMDDEEFDDYEEEIDPELGEEYHLNHITRADNGKLYIAGELGRYYRSDDGGATWLSLDTPYEGSYFGTLPLDGDSLLLLGMRGNLFRSDDNGESFQAIDTGVEALLTAGFADGDKLVLVGLAGVVMDSADGGQTFTLRRQEDRRGNMMALPTADGGMVLIGESGVQRLDLAEYRAGSAASDAGEKE